MASNDPRLYGGFLGGGRFIPPPQIAPLLASLGDSIARMANPGKAQRDLVRQQLYSNPEMLSAFAEAQYQLEIEAMLPPEIEGEQLQELADATKAPSGGAKAAARKEAGRPEHKAVPNVLEAMGFSPEQTRALLRGAPMTPERMLNRNIMAAKLPELWGEIAYEKALNDLQKLGLERQDMNRAAGRYFKWIEFASALPEDLRALALSMDTQKGPFLQYLLGTQQLEVQALIEQYKALAAGAVTDQDRIELELKAHELGLVYDNEIQELLDRAKETDNDEEVANIATRLNEKFQARETAFRNIRRPAPVTYIADEDRKWLRRNGIIVSSLRLESLDAEGMALSDRVGAAMAIDIAEGRIPMSRAGIRQAALSEDADGYSFRGTYTLMTAEDKEVWESMVLREARDEMKETPPEIDVSDTKAVKKKFSEALLSGDFRMAIMINESLSNTQRDEVFDFVAETAGATGRAFLDLLKWMMEF